MENSTLRVDKLYALFVHKHYILWLIILFIFKGKFSEFMPFIDISITIMLIVFVYNILYYYSYKYEFLNDQLIISKGVFSRTENYIEFFRVKDFRKHQSLWMRIFGVMKITLVSSDKISNVTNITGVPNSELLRKLRLDILQSRKLNRVLEVD